MQKSCTQCSASFEITKDDLKFYEDVSPIFNGKKEVIPPPTLCPDCRLQRRLAFRNERKLYHRKCDKTGRQIISIYAPDKQLTIFAPDEWWSDAWDPLDYGRLFDFNKPFFEQFAALLKDVPRLALNCDQCENCMYDHNTTFSKNCYLCFSAFSCEESEFAYMVTKCNNIMDALNVTNSEYCYECINVRGCYGGKHLQNCIDCTDCILCFDCIGCTRCIGCTNLRNADLHLFNKRVTEEEYLRYKEAMGSHRFSMEVQNHFKDVKKAAPQRSAFMVASENCTGDHILNSNNVTQSYEVENCQDIAYCNHVNNFKDSQDVYGALMGGELQYENSAAGGCTQVMAAYLSWHNNNSYYLNYCHHSSNLFGCIGLRRKKYCILNKEYSKEEYEELVPKIIEHMRTTGEWGQFFPIAISPYGYNETIAQEFFPLTKETVQERSWPWHEDGETEDRYLGPIYDIPDNIKDVSEEMTKHILRCEVTGKPYKIIPQELKFYRAMGIPLPRKSPDQRHMERMALRNPRKLWMRTCAKCGKQMETTYAPERPEIIYCEECYLKEVY